MNKRIITSMICAFFALNIFSQEEIKTVPVITVNGPQGNYLYLLMDPADYKKNDEFEIERVSNFQVPFPNNYDPKEEKVGTLKRIKNYNELANFFSTAELSEMKKNFGDISDRALAQKFIDLKSADELPFYYNDVEVKRALGMVYLDSDVQPNVNYYYKVKRKSDKRKEFSWSLGRGGFGNYILPNLKPEWSGSEGQDSLIRLQWSLPLNTTQEDFPISQVLSDAQYNQILFTLPFAYSALSAKVYTESNGVWNESITILPDFNEDKNALEFNYLREAIPESTTRAYIKLMDQVYNLGNPSDTAIVFAVDSVFAPFIYDIEVVDTLNGIHISWEPLPRKPYYAGIEILKYNSDEELDTVAYLQPYETAYVDRDVEIGQYYRYQVKALFIPQKGLVQTLPAQSVGTFSRFTKPLPPTNLTGETVGNFIELNWDYVDEPSIYGYYVYRGTSSKKLELVDGPIKEKTYTDSLEALSGRTHYFYAVVSQNYRQDTSAYSNIVTIRPDKVVTMTRPESVNIYYANGDMHIDWRDVRSGDNIIEGYILQRKKSLENDYSNIHAGVLKNASFKDENVTLGTTYYYRIAAVSMYGDQTDFSEGTEYFLAPDKVPTINEFNVRNVSDGVKISLPEMTFENRKSYNIYRRNVNEKEFEKISEIPANAFSYTDQNVVSNQLYVYMITTTLLDEREGPRGKGKTIRVN